VTQPADEDADRTDTFVWKPGDIEVEDEPQ
jgi:hypothetical protein